jgi:hypothetical protein
MAPLRQAAFLAISPVKFGLEQNPVPPRLRK